MDPKIFLGTDSQTIILLLLFITGILTKRIVPWWIHNEALEKLKAYEDAAPKLITEIQTLMDSLYHQQEAEDEPVTGPTRRKPTPNARRVVRRQRDD